MSRGGNIIDMLHDCEVSQFGKVHESSVNDKPKGWTSFDEGFKSGDKVQIHTDSDGWFGEYEFVRDASDKDLRDLSMNYLKDYKGKKYVVKNVHKGMFFGDLGIVTDKNIRKVCEGVYEDDWKTMHGAHILVDDNGSIKAGGPPSMRKGSSSGRSITTQKTASKKVNAKVSVEPYSGKRSGVKSLDKAFDDVRAAKAEWDKAKEDKAKAYKKVCKSLGIKADRKSSIYSSENQKKVKAAKDPDYIKATKDEDKAMSNHAKKTRVLKSEYKSYRDSGGEQIRDYYSASTEWDDYD